jgi:hypothetical protein
MGEISHNINDLYILKNGTPLALFLHETLSFSTTGEGLTDDNFRRGKLYEDIRRQHGILGIRINGGIAG